MKEAKSANCGSGMDEAISTSQYGTIWNLESIHAGGQTFAMGHCNVFFCQRERGDPGLHLIWGSTYVT